MVRRDTTWLSIRLRNLPLFEPVRLTSEDSELARPPEVSPHYLSRAPPPETQTSALSSSSSLSSTASSSSSSPSPFSSASSPSSHSSSSSSPSSSGDSGDAPGPQLVAIAQTTTPAETPAELRCSICLENVNSTDMRTPCRACGRGACATCLTAYISGEALRRRWPIPCIHCMRPLEPDACLAHLQGETSIALDALQELLVERVAFSDVTMRYCANPRCSEPFEYENDQIASFAYGRDNTSNASDARADEDGAYEELGYFDSDSAIEQELVVGTPNRNRSVPLVAVQCPLCGWRTCVTCGSQAHGERPCATDDDMGTDEDSLTALVLQKGWKACPRCSRLTSKDSSWSCNHCVCLCGTAFCFNCGIPYKTTQDIASSSTGESVDPKANIHGVPNCGCGLYTAFYR